MEGDRRTKSTVGGGGQENRVGWYHGNSIILR